MTITYNSGTNLITLDDSAGAGDSWVNAYDMEDVLAADVAGSWGVVTKQGANAYDVSARMRFQTGVYFKSTDEFVELRPNPANSYSTFYMEANSHVQLGEYNSTDKFSYSGAFWRIYLNSNTTNQTNKIYGEFLVYGSSIWTDSSNYLKGLMLYAGATVRYYNSIFRYSGYFWAADHDVQDVKWFGGTSTYDMLLAVGFSHAWAGLTTMNCNHGIFFSATTTANADVYGLKVLNSGTWDVYLSTSCAYLIRIINPVANPTVGASGSNRPGCQVCYTFNVKVTGSNGSPIVGATVELKNNDGDVVFSEDTIAGGVLAADKIVPVLWYRHANMGGNMDYNNHTLKISSGSDETEYDIDIDHQIKEDVVLIPQPLATYDNIMAGIEDMKGTGFVKDTDSLVDIRPETDKVQVIDDNMDLVLADTNELQGNQGNWETATGYATENPPSQNLDDYKATGFSTLTAIEVWAHGTRTLSSFGTLVTDIWNNAIRTLTAGTRDSEIDDILADTNELQTNQNNWLTATGFPSVGEYDEILDIIKKLTGNNVTKVGNIITIYEDDKITPWKSYDLAGGGRIEV